MRLVLASLIALLPSGALADQWAEEAAALSALAQTAPSKRSIGSPFQSQIELESCEVRFLRVDQSLQPPTMVEAFTTSMEDLAISEAVIAGGDLTIPLFPGRAALRTALDTSASTALTNMVIGQVSYAEEQVEFVRYTAGSPDQAQAVLDALWAYAANWCVP